MRAGLQKKSPVRREALSSLLQNWLRLASLPGSSVKCHQQEALQNHPSPYSVLLWASRGEARLSEGSCFMPKF